MLELKRKLKLLKYAFGTVMCYIIMGVYQERLFSQPYELDKVNFNCSAMQNATSHQCNGTLSSERFPFAFSYVGVQCFIYALVAKGQ